MFAHVGIDDLCPTILEHQQWFCCCCLLPLLQQRQKLGLDLMRDLFSSGRVLRVPCTCDLTLVDFRGSLPPPTALSRGFFAWTLPPLALARGLVAGVYDRFSAIYGGFPALFVIWRLAPRLATGGVRLRESFGCVLSDLRSPPRGRQPPYRRRHHEGSRDCELKIYGMFPTPGEYMPPRFR